MKYVIIRSYLYGFVVANSIVQLHGVDRVALARAILASVLVVHETVGCMVKAGKWIGSVERTVIDAFAEGHDNFVVDGAKAAIGVTEELLSVLGEGRGLPIAGDGVVHRFQQLSW